MTETRATYTTKPTTSINQILAFNPDPAAALLKAINDNDNLSQALLEAKCTIADLAEQNHAMAEYLIEQENALATIVEAHRGILVLLNSGG